MSHLRTIGLCFAAVSLLALARASPVPRAAPSRVSAQAGNVEVLKMVDHLKEVNYFPAHAAWKKMWTDFQPKVISRDFARIHALGANTVRIIVFPTTFGYPKVRSSMARRLSRVLRLAAQHSLQVQLTLFGWFYGFRDIRHSKEWAKSLLSPYRHDRRIAVLELKNEADPENPVQVHWVRRMLPYLRKLMPGTLRTVSVASVGPTEFESFTQELRSSPPDFWDYHFYGPSWNAHNVLAQIQGYAAGRPLFIGETGFSTYGPKKDRATLDLQQANYYQAVFQAATSLGLPPPAPWILYDFSHGAIPWSLKRSPKQYDFGLFRVNGTQKPAAAVVKQAFSAK